MKNVPGKKSSSAHSGRWFLLWKESAAEVYRTSGRNLCIYKTMFLSELFWLREIKEVRAWDAIKQNMKWERSEKHLFWMLAGVKWESHWTNIWFRRYIHSNLWGKAERFCFMAFHTRTDIYFSKEYSFLTIFWFFWCILLTYRCERSIRLCQRKY